MDRDFKNQIGNRIRSEFNDLKRTADVISREINVSVESINKVLKGEASEEEINSLLNKIGENYPIDVYDLFLIQDDCNNGIKIFDFQTSKNSARIFNRTVKSGDSIAYYEYRDTAMSKLGPFKPEWIKELSIVNDSDPENDNVVYNNGHFLHQLTFFIGKVNFYWMEGDKKFCKEMNTGDSNYISPFFPHSFASRDANDKGIIIAVTFGGNVRRAQKELYWLGRNRVDRYVQLAKEKFGENENPIITNNDMFFESFESYNIKSLASHDKLSNSRGFEIELMPSKDCEKQFESEYHGYLFNYGESPFIFEWEFNDKTYFETINSQDSIYIQPLIRYRLKNHSASKVNLILYEVAGALEIETQKELSLFNESDRISNEYKSWF